MEKAESLYTARLKELQNQVDSLKYAENKLMQSSIEQEQDFAARIDKGLEEKRAAMKAKMEAEQRARDAEQKRQEEEQKRLDAEAATTLAEQKAKEAQDAAAGGQGELCSWIKAKMVKDDEREQEREKREQERLKVEEVKLRFDFEGLLTDPKSEKFETEGIRFCREIKRSMREKIGRGEFVSMDDIFKDSYLLPGSSMIDMKSKGYAVQNVPVPTRVNSGTMLLRNLIFYIFYYIQTHPEHTLSCLDYLLYICSQLNTLEVHSVVALDHSLRQDFAAHPSWNWATHRSESTRTEQTIVTNALTAKINRATYGNFQQGRNQRGGHNSHGNNSNSSNRGGYSQNNNSNSSHSNPPRGRGNKRGPPRGGGNRGRGAKRPRKEDVAHMICDDYNNGSCSYKTCWKRHDCQVCSAPGHRAFECFRQRGAMQHSQYIP